MANVPSQLTTPATAIASGRGFCRNSSAPIIIGIGPATVTTYCTVTCANSFSSICHDWLIMSPSFFISISAVDPRQNKQKPTKAKFNIIEVKLERKRPNNHTQKQKNTQKWPKCFPKLNNCVTKSVIFYFFRNLQCKASRSPKLVFAMKQDDAREHIKSAWWEWFSAL